jgi:hypothetical protein
MKYIYVIYMKLFLYPIVISPFSNVVRKDVISLLYQGWIAMSAIYSDIIKANSSNITGVSHKQ